MKEATGQRLEREMLPASKLDDQRKCKSSSLSVPLLKHPQAQKEAGSHLLQETGPPIKEAGLPALNEASSPSGKDDEQKQKQGPVKPPSQTQAVELQHTRRGMDYTLQPAQQVERQIERRLEKTQQPAQNVKPQKNGRGMDSILPTPGMEQIRLEDNPKPALEVEAEAPNPNFLLGGKPHIRFSETPPDLSSLPEQEHATLGDYLVYICESVRTLIQINSRTNQSLSSHASMIGSLQQRLNLVSDRQKNVTMNTQSSGLEANTSHIPTSRLETETSHNPALRLETVTSPNPSSILENQNGEITQNPATRLEDETHHNPASRLEDETPNDQPSSQPTDSEITPSQPFPPTHPAQGEVIAQSGGISQSRQNTKEVFTCEDCGFKARNLKRLDTHISISHSRPNHFQALRPATLLIGDSHQKSLKRKWCVEKALGGNGRLLTPGITYPNEDRAYCSTRDWPGAWHPENSLEEMLPRLLKERPYSSAIILAPCNDITNLRGSSPEEQWLMASQSSRNTVRVIEDALRTYPTLRKLVCTERPVRVDDLAELSQYSNSELRRLAAASEYSSRIVVSSNMSEFCSTEEEKVNVFKAPNSKGADGIHMRGEKGGEFFTEMLIAAAKLASLSASGLDGRRQAASKLDAQEPRKPRRPYPASGLENQHQRTQPATWAEVASNNRFSVFQSNQSN